MTANNKSVFIAFLGNPFLDARLVNLKKSLEDDGLDVTIVGFDFKSENFKSRRGKTSVYKLNKRKAAILFYLKFSLILAFRLFKSDAKIYFAEDIYSLPLISIFGRRRKAKTFYNSREIYAHIGGLREKHIIQSLIANTEKNFIYKVDHVLVTGAMDADYLKGVYGLEEIIVLRNLPLLKEVENKIDLRKKFSIPEKSKILIYQGVILEGRGIPFIFKIIENLPDVHFIVIGDGEFKTDFENLAKRSIAFERIHFTGSVPHSELLGYTSAGNVGVTVIENISISYYYALPNKLFEYIMTGIPVIASDLPQMKKIIDDYEVGITINPDDFDKSLKAISALLSDENKLSAYSEKTKIARLELNWQKEYENIKSFLQS